MEEGEESPLNRWGPLTKVKMPAGVCRLKACAAPPMSACASSTQTERPAVESSAAALSPPRPDPMTTASYFGGCAEAEAEEVSGMQRVRRWHKDVRGLGNGAARGAGGWKVGGVWRGD